MLGPQTKIEVLLAAAERYHLDILAGHVLERGRSSGWAAFLAVEGDALVSHGVPRGYVGNVPLFDVVLASSSDAPGRCAPSAGTNGSSSANTPISS